MKNNGLTEIILSCIIIALVIALLNPFNFMTSMTMMMVQLALVVVFALFVGFVWKERGRDERELLHRALAGRVSFLAGSTVLVIGIVVQGLMYHVDPWLVSALAVMVLAKLAVVIYNNNH